MRQDSGKPKASRTVAQQPAPARPTADPGATISSIACSLAEARGRIDGHALEDWLEAEARVGQRAPAAKPDAARATVEG